MSETRTGKWNYKDAYNKAFQEMQDKAMKEFEDLKKKSYKADKFIAEAASKRARIKR